MIALCSKCHHVDEHDSEKKKFSTKGMSENRGLRKANVRMATYEQQKLSLSAYCNKRWVLPDGVHTEPIEFQTT